MQQRPQRFVFLFFFIGNDFFANQIKKEVVEKVLELRKEHKLGTWRIKWYLERYHDINISESSVFRILKRNKVERLDSVSTKISR